MIFYLDKILFEGESPQQENKEVDSSLNKEINILNWGGINIKDFSGDTFIKNIGKVSKVLSYSDEIQIKEMTWDKFVSLYKEKNENLANNLSIDEYMKLMHDVVEGIEVINADEKAKNSKFFKDVYGSINDVNTELKEYIHNTTGIEKTDLSFLELFKLEYTELSKFPIALTNEDYFKKHKDDIIQKIILNVLNGNEIGSAYRNLIKDITA